MPTETPILEKAGTATAAVPGPAVCILGATFNTNNMGVSMLAAGAIQFVLNRFPDARVSFLDYAHAGSTFDFSYGSRTVPIRFLNIRFSKKFYLANNIALLLLLVVLARVFVPVRSVRNRLLSRNPWLRGLLASKVCFAVSGGDSFSDIYGLGRFLYVTLPQLLVLFTGTPLVQLPQTYGPFKSTFARLVARYILRRSEHAFARDQHSLSIAREVMDLPDAESRASFCYDMAFAVAPRKPAAADIVGLSDDGGRPLVGFNVSGLLLAGGYTQDNMFGLKVDYRTLVTATIDYLIREKSVNVVLVPHVFGSASHMESDSGACETIYQALKDQYPAGRLALIRGTYRHDEIKQLIGRCDFFLGARMHACIAALSQAVPAVLIAYSDKFAGMLQSVGGGIVVDPRKLDIEQTLAAVDQAFEQRQALASELSQKMPHVKATIGSALAPFWKDAN